MKGTKSVKILRKAVCFPLFFILFFTHAFAQEQMHRRIGELGFGLGGANYIGDLSPSYKPEFTRPAFSIFYRANFNNDHLVFRTNLTMGGFYADESRLKDQLQQERGLKFSASFFELAGLFEYNFLDYRSSKEYNLGRAFSPYMFLGLGFLFPDGSGNTQAQLVTAIPYGVGVKFILSHHWNLGIEVGGRKTFTDMLDGYTNDEINNTSKINDHYLITSLTLSYTFYSFDCPSTSPLINR